MKKITLYCLFIILSLMMAGCGKEEFVFGNKELVHLTSTPVGVEDTYKIYTTNIMIYADGTVNIYASDFVRWFGDSDIPVETFTISQDEVNQIKELILTHEVYELRENVGNKDGINGTDKYITVYSSSSSHRTGGTSVSNRQFVRAYDGIYEIVRENVYTYLGYINQVQHDGYVEFQNRSVKITDSTGNIFIETEYINNVYAGKITDEEGTDYVIYIEFDKYGIDVLNELTENCGEDVLTVDIFVNDSYETSFAITEPVIDGVLKVPCVSEEYSQALVGRINASIR